MRQLRKTFETASGTEGPWFGKLTTSGVQNPYRPVLKIEDLAKSLSPLIIPLGIELP